MFVADHVDYVARLHEALPGLADQVDPRQLDVAAAPALRSVVLLGGRRGARMLTGERFAAGAERHTDDEVWTRHLRTSVRITALMMYTSGTTAMPKGCVMSHEPLVRTSVVEWSHEVPDHRGGPLWDPLPMFHMSAILPLIGVFDGRARSCR